MPGPAVHSFLSQLLPRRQPIWLAGGTAADRTALLKSFAREQQGTYLSLGATFSELYAKADSFSQKRPDTLLLEHLGQLPEPVCLDHTDILFDAYLPWDPWRVLEQLALRCPCLISWPGTDDGTTLYYPDSNQPCSQYPRDSLLTYSVD